MVCWLVGLHRRLVRCQIRTGDGVVEADDQFAEALVEVVFVLHNRLFDLIIGLTLLEDAARADLDIFRKLHDLCVDRPSVLPGAPLHLTSDFGR